MPKNPYGDPYLGEVRLFAGERTPPGWMTCDGQRLAKAEHRALFDTIGMRFGGDGDSFALPDLRGRVPVDSGWRKRVGDAGGQEKVELTRLQMPSHRHGLMASTADAKTDAPSGSVAGTVQEIAVSAYGQSSPIRPIDPRSMRFAGEGHGHENLAASTCLNFIVAVEGVAPGEHEGDSDHTPLVGEVRPFALGFNPSGFLLCDGDTFEIRRWEALNRVIGNAFGGDGRSTFAVPNLKGRVPIHAGQGPGLTPRTRGAQVGANAVSLQTDELPAHTHGLAVSGDAANARDPSGLLFAIGDGVNYYGDASYADVELAPEASTPSGGGKAHANMQPYLTINYTIAAQGIYPYPT